MLQEFVYNQLAFNLTEYHIIHNLKAVFIHPQSQHEPSHPNIQRIINLSACSTLLDI